eukprot:EG_transcript_4959
MVSTYRGTQALLLRGTAVMYLCAFWSLWVQLPELYGPDGLLPVRTFLARQGTGVGPGLGNLVAYHDELGVPPDLLLEWVCLVGMLGSLLAAAGLTTAPLFLLLWGLYSSAVHVGQTFLQFQWDALLLETGAVAVLLAPLLTPTSKAAPPYAALVWFRVILFKLLFMTAVVKLQSRCPTWLQLTALRYHYATQCLPNPVSWYAHQLPDNLQDVCVAVMFVIQLPAIFLMFVPWRGIRRVAAWSQITLQLLIMATGNYNWFNLHAMLLATSLMDDELWPVSLLASEHDRPWPRRRFLRVLKGPQSLTSLAYLVASAGVLFRWSLAPDPALPLYQRISVQWRVSQPQVSAVVPHMLLAALVGTAVSFGYYSLRQVWAAFQTLRLYKLAAVGNTLWHTVVLAACTAGIAMNCIPLAQLDESGTAASAVPTIVQEWYTPTFAGSYGLFRHMTGVGQQKEVARPEIILEGSADGAKWLPYEFHYKPGNLSRHPVFVVPHQPRIDWQMWFAALGHYRHNPWLLHLAYKLLRGPPSPTVARIFHHNPFPDTPPALLRATLWHYDFTTGNSSRWWRRRRAGEYLPVLNVSSLEPAMEHFGWLGNPDPAPAGWVAVVPGLVRRCEAGVGWVLAVLLLGRYLWPWLPRNGPASLESPPKPKTE